MKCHLAALCDAANTTPEGKINLLGEFDTLWSPQAPVVWPLMTFIAKLKFGEVDVGRHTISLRVLDEDMHIIAVPIEGQGELGGLESPGIENGWPLILSIVNAQFPEFGTYLFQLVLDGNELISVPLHVRERPAG